MYAMPRLRLELGRHIVIEGECRSHALLLRSRHHDAKPLREGNHKAASSAVMRKNRIRIGSRALSASVRRSATLLRSAGCSGFLCLTFAISPAPWAYPVRSLAQQ